MKLSKMSFFSVSRKNKLYFMLFCREKITSKAEIKICNVKFNRK